MLEIYLLDEMRNKIVGSFYLVFGQAEICVTGQGLTELVVCISTGHSVGVGSTTP